MCSMTSSTPAESRGIRGFLPRQPDGPKEGNCGQLEAKVLWKNKDSPLEGYS